VAFGAPSVKGRALAHLARREHSRAELERKLAAKVQDQPDRSAEAQITRALDELAARGLQSDARAAESVLNTLGARYGSRRIEQALRLRGLGPELTAGAVEQARRTDLERARAIWQRRFGMPAANPAERAKQARFLAARGFPAEVVRQVVRGVEED
jgi:regulatory protein